MNVALHPSMVGPFRLWLEAQGLALSEPIPLVATVGAIFHVVVPDDHEGAAA